MSFIRFLFTLRVYWLVLLVVIVGLACNAPVIEETVVSEPETMTEEAPELAPAEITEETVLPFLEITVSPRDASKMILKAVEPDQNANVARVVLLLPETLLGAEISVNGEVLSYTAVNPVELVMAGAALAPDVSILILPQGQPTYTCNIQMANPLYPSGDCTW